MTKLALPSVSVLKSTDVLASAVEDASHGLLIVEDLPQVPIDDITELFDQLAGSNVGARLNEAYAKNLVYKDSYAAGKGGPDVDRKRVLDLSPERLEIIDSVDHDVLAVATSESEAFAKTMKFWDAVKAESQKIVSALAHAIGDDVVIEDAAYNYRMVDYYEHLENDPSAPRCGEHRDFGSFTLIFPSSEPGLQVMVDDKEWIPVPSVNPGCAILLFGWCTQIRSNGRIPAALHRVVDSTSSNDMVVPRRTTAVLFCAPKNVETSLEPVVRDGEFPRYIGGLKVGQLRGKMARKWQKREGTLKDEDAILEEEEIRVTNMVTQDDVVNRTIAV